MKRKLSLLFAILLTVCLFASCGDQRPSGGTVTAPDTSYETEDSASDSENKEPEYDPSSVAPLLWKVTDADGRELYLFGKIHVGDERTAEALEKLSGRIKECGALAVEFDVVAYESDLSAVMNDMKKYVLTDGTKIYDHMPAELYEKAEAELQEASCYYGMLDLYGPALWYQLVESALIINESELKKDFAMDPQLINFAYDNGIDVLDVESPEFQNDMILSFSDGLLLLLIEEALENTEEYGESVNELYEAWVRGDDDVIIDLTASEYDDLTGEELEYANEYTTKMVIDRNIGMADKAEEYLASGQKVFFAVGTGHMVGEGGIVDLLTQRGYTVERVPVE